MQRRGRYRTIARWPDQRSQVMAPLFGQAGSEDHPTLENGRLTVHVNSFAIRFVADIYNSERLADCEIEKKVWRESIAALFRDENVSHLFLSADASVLRKVWQCGDARLDYIDFGNPRGGVSLIAWAPLARACDCATADSN